MKFLPDKARKQARKQAQAKSARMLEFQKVTDPMIGKVLRGEIPIEEYRAKVDEIRARHPYPDEE